MKRHVHTPHYFGAVANKPIHPREDGKIRNAIRSVLFHHIVVKQMSRVNVLITGRWAGKQR